MRKRVRSESEAWRLLREEYRKECPHCSYSPHRIHVGLCAALSSIMPRLSSSMHLRLRSAILRAVRRRGPSEAWLAMPGEVAPREQFIKEQLKRLRRR